MTWAAIGASIAGAVVSAGAGAAISAANAPGPGFVGKPPPYSPIDIKSLGNEVFAQNTLGYNMADADFAKRFPGLVATRNQQMDDAYKQLTGPLDSTVQNSFTRDALENSLGAVAGGNPLGGIGGAGSAGFNRAGVDFANSVMQKQDYDRTNFQNIMDSPYALPRTATLGPEDAVQLSLLNTQQLNEHNQAAYNAKIQEKNAQNTGGGF